MSGLLVYWIIAGSTLWMKPPFKPGFGNFCWSMLLGGFLVPILVFRKLI